MNGFVELTFDPEKGLESIRVSLLKILLRWWNTHPKWQNNIDSITQCIMQMMLLKIRSLQIALKGLPLIPNGQKQTIYLDLSNMASIARGIYETAFIYHNIFICPENDNERDVLINIWKIEGFNNRLKVPVPENMMEDVVRNNNTLESLRKKTRDILDGMDINEYAKAKIEKVIKRESSNIKGYKFIKTGNKIIDFKSIDFTDAQNTFKHKYMDGTYPFLSYQSHPSYLGLFQFGQLTGRENLASMGESFLMIACICATRFANDACKIMSDGESIKKEVEPDIRATINFLENI